jgi:hypothetical protein
MGQKKMTQKILKFGEGDSYLVLKELQDIKDFLRLQGESFPPKGMKIDRNLLDDEFFIYLFLKQYKKCLIESDKETYEKLKKERKERNLDILREGTYEDFSEEI